MQDAGRERKAAELNLGLSENEWREAGGRRLAWCAGRQRTSELGEGAAEVHEGNDIDLRRVLPAERRCPFSE